MSTTISLVGDNVDENGESIMFHRVLLMQSIDLKRKRRDNKMQYLKLNARLEVNIVHILWIAATFTT